MIHVRTPSRLHFGLFSLPAGDAEAAWLDRDGQPNLPARAFGGVGLMIERPGLALSVEPAATWSADGPLAERALACAQQVSAALQLDQAFRLVVEGAPREHTGLGTGTQLALAVARAVTLASGRPDVAPVDLARLVGRGQRSALGIQGFAHGGFLVEGGKRSPDAIAPLVARVAFPAEWSILLVIPDDLSGDHGARETAAFRSLAQNEPDLQRTDALCRLVLLGMLPALAERDLDAFGEALYDFNRRVGEMFRPWQGDLYAQPRTAELVAAIRSTGRVRGVGQTSWGPTVFAVVRPAEAPDLCDWLLRRHGCRSDELIVTAAANAGAVAGHR